MILKKIVKFCSVVGLACLLICLAVLPFVKKDELKSCYANSLLHPLDTVITSTNYQSSNIGIPVSLFSSNDASIMDTSYVSSTILMYKFYFNSSNNTFTFYMNPYVSSAASITYQGSYVFDGSYDTWNRFYLDADIPYYIIGSLRFSTGFDFNVVKINLKTNSSFGGNSNFRSVNFTYYDDNNKTLQISFSCKPDLTGIVVDERYYYLSSNFSDNDYYQQGLSDGEQNAINQYSQDWFNRGKAEGEIIGDAAGYSRGVNSAHRYTFFNLFGAMFDVPVRFITGFFNFNLLGVNLLNLVTGLLTLSLIIRLIKWISGGK